VRTVRAQGNYVLVQLESNWLRLRESMSSMTGKLAPHGFVRIHQSVLVNRAWVEKIYPYLPGKYRLRLKDGKEFTVTRTYKANLRCLAEVWLGKETLIGCAGKSRTNPPNGVMDLDESEVASG
jgi:DNA-binding LytR/AlgR family response regulator